MIFRRLRIEISKRHTDDSGRGQEIYGAVELEAIDAGLNYLFANSVFGHSADGSQSIRVKAVSIDKLEFRIVSILEWTSHNRRSIDRCC